MTQLFMFEKPLGLRDTLPVMHKVLHQVKGSFYDEMEKWGYEFIATPALEYDETIGKVSAISDNQLFKLLDREGHTVVLRPDMTTPIARVAASALKKEPLPLRLSYMAALFRSQQYEGGRPSEFEQAGAELIGDPTASADAEMIALMIKLLKLTGLENIRIALGHIGFVDALLSDIIQDQSSINRLKSFLYKKNDVGFRDYIKYLELPEAEQRRLLTFIDSRKFDNKKTLGTIKELLPHQYGRTIYQNVSELMALLAAYDVSGGIDLDITLVSHLSYYTGFVFEGYGGNQGFAVCNGGRYDELLEKFDRSAPATGFGIRLDRLAEAVNFKEQGMLSKKTLIIFSRDRYEEALNYANEQRRDGKVVILQGISGISDLDAFTKPFDHVVQFTV